MNAIRRLGFIFVFLALFAGNTYAQYAPIPNEPSGSGCPGDVTQCSAYKVRQDINNRFGGTVPIAPSYTTATITASGVIAPTVARVYCNGSGAITLTLPAALLGQSAIEVTNLTTNTCTVQRAGSDTINGGTSIALSTQYQAVNLEVEAAGAWINKGFGGPPGGSAGELQYNNTGVFGGVPAVNGDGTLNTATGALSVNTVEGGKTPVVTSGANTAAGSSGADSLNNFNVNGVLNVMDFGASGSPNTYTCSISASSQTLTCTAATDFKAGEYVAIPGAGAATPLSPVTAAPTVTKLGTAGAATDCYEVVAGDPAEGLTAPTAAGCIATGPAAGAFTALSGLSVAFTQAAGGNQEFGVYRSIAGGAYTFVAATDSSPYNDYGSDWPKSFDWPSTAPAARDQTAYCKVVSGASTSWTVDCTASQGQASAVTAATSVTVRHDETIGVQAAEQAAAGKEVYLPAGTYHMNMIGMLNAGVIGYQFDSTTAAYGAIGRILASSNGVVFRGAGNKVTTVEGDWRFVGNVRGTMLNIATAAMYGYFGPDTGGASRFTSYPFNTASLGDTCITLPTPANASNFGIGDFAFLTGGQAVNGSYTIPNITQVTSSNATTGAVCFADGITSNLPFGTGVANYISNLTTNNAIVNGWAIEDINFDTPEPISSNDAVYDFTASRLIYHELHNTALFYNEWSENSLIADNDFISGYFEYPLGAHTSYLRNNWRVWSAYGTINFDGAETPLVVKDNLFSLTCGDSLYLEWTDVQAQFSHNTVNQSCTSTPAADTATLTTAPTSSAATCVSQLIDGNIFDTDAASIIQNSDSIYPNCTGTIVANNSFQYRRSSTQPAGTAIFLAGGVKVQGNQLTETYSGTSVGNGGIGVIPLSGSPMPEVENNLVVNTGVQDLTCITIFDGGSVISAPIKIAGNRCDGAHSMLLVYNPTDTPFSIIQLLGNISNGMTSPYPEGGYDQIQNPNGEVFVGVVNSKTDVQINGNSVANASNLNAGTVPLAQSQAPSQTETLTGATPTITVPSATQAFARTSNYILGANATSITTPAAAGMADGQSLTLVVQQAHTGGPYTIPTTGVSGSPFTAGAGVTIKPFAQQCPTVPTTADETVWYRLLFHAATGILELVGCNASASPSPPPPTGLALASAFSVASSTTLTAITGMTFNLTTGHTYHVTGFFSDQSGSAGYDQFDLGGGTATATTVQGVFTFGAITGAARYGELLTALTTATTTGGTDMLMQFDVYIVCSGSGTLIPRFAQNVSNATASTLSAGSGVTVTQIN